MTAMEIYMTMYAVCFILTLLVGIVALVIGDIEEAAAYSEGHNEGYEKTTRRQWTMAIIKMTILDALVSLASPLILLLYLIAFGAWLLDIIMTER